MKEDVNLLPHLVLRSADATPERSALTHDDTTLTYAQFLTA
jgi:hypothetical protein